MVLNILQLLIQSKKDRFAVIKMKVEKGS